MRYFACFAFFLFHLTAAAQLPPDSLARRFARPGAVIESRAVELPGGLIFYIEGDAKWATLNVLTHSGPGRTRQVIDTLGPTIGCRFFMDIDSVFTADLDVDPASELVVIVDFSPMCDNLLPMSKVFLYDDPATGFAPFADPGIVIYALPPDKSVIRKRAVAELKQKGFLPETIFTGKEMMLDMDGAVVIPYSEEQGVGHTLNMLSFSGFIWARNVIDTISVYSGCYSEPFLDTVYPLNLDADTMDELVVIVNLWPTCDTATPYATAFYYDDRFNGFKLLPLTAELYIEIRDLPVNSLNTRKKVAAILTAKGFPR